MKTKRVGYRVFRSLVSESRRQRVLGLIASLKLDEVGLYYLTDVVLPRRMEYGLSAEGVDHLVDLVVDNSRRAAGLWLEKAYESAVRYQDHIEHEKAMDRFHGFHLPSLVSWG